MADRIIVFTLHKCASTFIHRQTKRLCKKSNIVHYSPNGEDRKITEEQLLTDKDIWLNKGCFAPVRFFVDVPQIQECDVILHLRDPRDVLVSMFYSYCYIHPGEIPANTGYRQEVASRGIDEFVLNKASAKSLMYQGDYGTGSHVEKYVGNFPQRYDDYINKLLNQSNVTLVKYEEMVTNYRAWLTKFVRSFPLKPGQKINAIEQLVKQSSDFFPQRDRDTMTHVRHITPGDYKNKLKPDTIERLNDIFANTLNILNYEQ